MGKGIAKARALEILRRDFQTKYEIFLTPSPSCRVPVTLLYSIDLGPHLISERLDLRMSGLVWAERSCRRGGESDCTLMSSSCSWTQFCQRPAVSVNLLPLATSISGLQYLLTYYHQLYLSAACSIC